MVDLDVFVNLTWLVPGEVGGSEESTTDALRAVLANRPDIQLRLAALGPFARAHPDLVEAVPTEILDLSGESRVRRIWSDQTWLANRVRATSPDVVHHAGGVIPLIHPGVATLTVHDIQPLDMPANFTTTKRLYMRAMLGRSVKAARVICTPSEFTRRRVIDQFSVLADKVRVVPWCVRSVDSRALDAVGDVVERAAEDSTQDATDGADGTPPAASLPGGVKAPFLLYPAITHPHKNHLLLIDAFVRVLVNHPELSLVLPGGAGLAEDAVRQRLAHGRAAASIIRLPRLPAAEIDRLYSASLGVVIPSAYEGFGLPALEAMKRGVPVLISDAGSLPEVAGGQAMLDPVKANDVTAWAAAMQDFVEMSGEARQTLIAAGTRAAARFSQQCTADALAGAWHSANDDSVNSDSANQYANRDNDSGNP